MRKLLSLFVLVVGLACSPAPTSPSLLPARGDNGPVGGGPGNSVIISRSCTGYTCLFTDVTTKGNYSSERRDWFANWRDSTANLSQFVAADFPGGTSPTFSVTYPTCPTGHACSYEIILWRWARSKGVSADSVFALP